MRHHKLELFPQLNSANCACWHSSPAFGLAGDVAPYAVQKVVLNDGSNRVVVGVYNRPLPLDEIKRIARIAVDGNYARE